MGLDPFVFQPRWGRAGGRVLEQIRARQAELVGELRDLDRQVDRMDASGATPRRGRHRTARNPAPERR